MLSAIKKNKAPYLFILPFFILFFAFQLIPLIWTIAMSFTEWNGIGTPKSIGAANYAMLLRDKMFWDAFNNTVLYWMSAVIFILMLAMILALIVNSLSRTTKSIFSTVVFLPNVCAAIAMGLIFRLLFDDNVGLINEIIILFKGTAQQWLTSTRMSKVPVIALNVWRNSPWFMLILYSGLLSINRDYYDAAKVDGAGFIRQFVYITLPELRNIIFFCFITLTVDSWKLFNEPYILRGPGTSNTSLFQYMYEMGFTIFRMGYASAIGCILMLILLVISLAQFAVRKKQGEI